MLIRGHGTNEPADETLKLVRKPAHNERLLLSRRWTYPRVIRLMPPLMETGNEIAQMVSRLEAAITAVEKRASVA
jgi:4-aminobutyrate aminotransferase-like enzyme